ncbi:MAG: carboxypeptidase regulatory-like domain-containing protein [Puia sp.]|nr:carboxypeptidase regulatory-like domain-containing protein [Puia sp.]
MAQVTTADVLGTVSDGSGSIVVGARVVIENQGTRVTQTTLSSDTGEYVFTLLPAGPYKISIIATGFKRFVSTLVVAAGDRARVDARMTLGEASESVEVTAQAPALQTDSSALSSVVTEMSVQDLPLNGRNFINLVQLTAGANEGLPGGLTSGTRPDDRRQSSSVSVNGQADVFNNQLIDGMDNNERAIGTIGVRPSIDAISEVQVQTNEYTADVGRTAGGVINIITKSGTNDYHGSMYEFFRNDILNSKDFFADTGLKPEYRQNQFGGSVGGPLRKNRTFFFGDYEGLRVVQGITTITTVPSLKEHSGDFSELLPNTVIYNPTTGLAYADNKIGTISPIAANYMKLYPLPNLPGLSNNYSSTQNKTQFSHTGDIRLDQHFNDKNTFFARYTINDVTTFTPGLFPAVDGIQGGGNPDSYPGLSLERAQNILLNYVHLFSTHLFLELKAGYTRVTINSNPLNYGKNVSTQFGITGANVDGITGLTLVRPVDYAPLGEAYYLPIQYDDNTFQYNGAVTYIAGSHTLKAGVALLRRQVGDGQSAYPLGYYHFRTAQTANPTTQEGGNSMASFLAGYAATAVRSNELSKPGFRMWEPGMYFEDDWRARPWLTLNLGVRYDIYTPYTEAHDRLSNFDTSTGKVVVANKNGVSSTAGVETDHSNVAPRIGFAATLHNGVVLRGGYGLTYFPGNVSSAAALVNAPYNFSYGPVSNVLLSTGMPEPVASDPDDPVGTLTGEQKNFRSGVLQQFNLNLQKPIGPNVLSLAYIGQLGRHLPQELPNLALPTPCAGTYPCSSIPFASTVPDVDDIQWTQTEGTSSYHAMQASFLRRYSHGLDVSSNYTWAHGIDDASTISNNYAAGIYLAPSKISTYDRGNSDLDIRHRFIATVNYQLPFGKSLTGAAKRILDEWQANGIFVWETGQPYTIINQNNPQVNLGPSVGADRPNQTKSANLSNPSISEWFDTSAFSLQSFGTLGNVGRNTFYGPHQRHFDFSLFREILLTKYVKLQFRAESFNLTNTPSFAAPDSGLGDSGFGTISSTNSSPRQFQFALKLLF